MPPPKTNDRSTKATIVRVSLDPSLKSSLVHLPMNFYAPLVDHNVAPQSLVVEIESLGQDPTSRKPYYAGWTGMSAALLGLGSSLSQSNGPVSSSSITDILAMSPSLAASFEPPLKDGTTCSVRLLRSPPLPIASQINVTPLTPDDWEILSLHAEEIEMNMLGQIRAAKDGQVITVHVGRTGCTLVRFCVDSTLPTTTSGSAETEAEQDTQVAGNIAVLLSNDTEVIIAPRLRQRPQDSLASENHQIKPSEKVVNGSYLDEAHQQLVQTIPKLLWRVLPSHFATIDQDEWQQQAVFLPPRSSLASNITYQQVRKVFPNGKVSITKVSCPKSDSPSASGTGSENLKPTEASGDNSQQVHPNLPSRPTASAHFESGEGYLSGSGNRSDAVSWPERHVLIGSALRHQLGIQDYDLVRLSAPPPGSAVRHDEAPVQPGMEAQSTQLAQPTPKPASSPNLAGVDQIIESAIETVVGMFQSRRLHNASTYNVTTQPFLGSSGLLLSGGPGSGKTVMAQEISNRLSSDFQLLMSTCRVDCTPFAEERVPVLRLRFSEWLNEAAWKSPSLLVLDNLDRIIPAEMEHVESQRARQLAEAFVSRIRDCVKEYKVFVIVTAQNSTSLHSLLNSSHLWIDNVQLKPPSKEGRREILNHLVKEKTRYALGDETETHDHDLNFVTLSTQTEGYLPADLKDWVERAVHQSAIRAATVPSSHVDNPSDYQKEQASVSSANPTDEVDVEKPKDAYPGFHLTMSDFSKAQEGFTPLSLRDVKLEKSSVAWSDIGGLQETRRVLRETLEWPTKYAAIFAGCPLRLRSGLLLYGYPGCGKTLLASAVAKECGLNFISVKGPEILNKYIGASEKSVRDLFDRAQAAKPCVLFFDEFDSIAPKRGHDSTGVTDRVVNQMLTQMDGAEGLDGVYVLAATSRPDLIDSALLRPGRLDKSLLCDMPNLEDRVDIIRAISSKVQLDPNVDMNKWAARTEGFSGADLQALLYNAHLETIHESINSSASTVNGADGISERDKAGTADKQLKFVSFGGNDGGLKKTLSGAEQQALSRKIQLVLHTQHTKAMEAGSKQQQRQVNGARNQDLEASSQGLTEKAKSKKILINDGHLETCIQSTRPSVPVEEQRRLRRIYKSFAGERDAHFPDGEASNQIGARSSLM